MPRLTVIASRFIALLLALAALGAAQAQVAASGEEAAFYRSHPLTIEVGYSPGNGYDVLTRVLARYLARYMPGPPTITIVNRPGAGSLATTNRLFAIARKDGSEIAVIGRSLIMEPLLGNKQANYDPTRFSWIANVGPETSVCVAWHQSGFATWQDLFSTRTFVAGANSPASDTGVFANLLKELFGANIRVVPGYPGGTEITRAIESREVDGRCGWSIGSIASSKPGWLTDKTVNVLVQVGLERHWRLPDVPLVSELATDDRQRRILDLILRRQGIAWPFAAPPGLADARLATLRIAFERTLADAEFVQDAGKIGIEVRPGTGAVVAAGVQAMYRTDPVIVEQVRKLLNP